MLQCKKKTVRHVFLTVTDRQPTSQRAAHAGVPVPGKPMPMIESERASKQVPEGASRQVYASTHPTQQQLTHTRTKRSHTLSPHPSRPVFVFQAHNLPHHNGALPPSLALAPPLAAEQNPYVGCVPAVYIHSRFPSGCVRVLCGLCLCLCSAVVYIQHGLQTACPANTTR